MRIAQGKEPSKQPLLPWVEFSLSAFLVCALAYLLAPLVTNPTPFMDEGYYMGATHSILKGDLLLHKYAFDKPFLLAWMPLPGILLFGENPIGFHVMPLLFSLVGVVLFFLALQGATLARTLIQTVLNGGFSLFLFTLPALRSLEVSNFCEPYLLFFGSLILYGLTNKKSRFQDSTLARIFICGLFVKFSFALWAPVLGFADFVVGKRTWPTGFREWVRTLVVETVRWLKLGKVFLIIGLIITAWNAVPFSAILWFSGMSGVGVPRFDGVFAPLLNLGDRTIQWVSILVSSLGVPFSSFAGTLILMFASINLYRRGLSGWLLLALISAAVHFFAYPITGVQLLSRYIVQFLPLFVFTLALIASRVGVLRLGVLALLGTFCFLNLREPAGAIGGDERLGREAYVLREDLDRSRTVLSNGNLWVTEAFHDQLINSGCLSRACFDDFHSGIAVQRDHFLLKDNTLWRIVPRSIQDSSNHSRPGFMSISSTELAELVLKRLKIHKAVALERILETGAYQEATEPYEGYRIHRLYDGSSFTLKARVTRGVSGLVEIGQEVGVEFVLGFNDARESPKEFNQPRTLLMARILLFKIGDRDVTDLIMPLFHRGYTFPVAILKRPWSSEELILAPKFTKEGGAEGISYSILSLGTGVNQRR